VLKLILVSAVSLLSVCAQAQTVECPPGMAAYCAHRAYESTANSIAVDTARKMLAISNESYERHPDAAHKTMVDEDQMRLNAAIARQ
jgi:hypothetical protein